MINAVNVHRLTKCYPGITALDSVTFQVGEGQVHGLLGPNGAGKTTTMKILSGLTRFSEGDVEIFGRPLKGQLGWLKNRIGYLPERPPLYDDMLVQDFLIFIGRIHHLDKKTAEYQANKSLEKMGIENQARRPIRILSKGLKQRVAIAQTLVYDPELLILDEPTSGLDPASIVEIRSLIKQLKNDHTIILSTHLLHEVELICDHITLIHQGKIVISGDLGSVRAQYKSQHSVDVTLSNWNDQIRNEMIKLPFVKDIRTLDGNNQNGKNIELKILIDEGTNNQSLLAETLVKNHCGLLQMRKQQSALEDIFLNLTQGAKQ